MGAALPLCGPATCGSFADCLEGCWPASRARTSGGSKPSRLPRGPETSPASFPLLRRLQRQAVERAFVQSGLPAELSASVLPFLGGPPEVLLAGCHGLAFARDLPAGASELGDRGTSSWAAVTALAVEPSLGWLVCALAQNPATFLWDWPLRGEAAPGIRRCFEGLPADVTCVGLGHDGRHAAGMADGSLRLWDAWTGQALGNMLLHIWPQYTYVYWGHSCAVQALAMPPASAPCYASPADGTLPWLLLSGSLDGSLCMWDASGTCCFCTDAGSAVGETGGVGAVAWACGGSLALAAVAWSVVGYRAGPSATGLWPAPVIRLGWAPWDRVPRGPVTVLQVLREGLLAADPDGLAAFWDAAEFAPAKLVEEGERRGVFGARAARPRRPQWCCRHGSGPDHPAAAASGAAVANVPGFACWPAPPQAIRWLEDGLLLEAPLPVRVQNLMCLGQHVVSDSAGG